MGNILKEGLKVAGTLGGAYFGGIPGAIGGRALGGLLTKEDTDSLIKNSLLFGGLAGGGANYFSGDLGLEGLPGYGALSKLWSSGGADMPELLGMEGDNMAAKGGGGGIMNTIKDNPIMAMLGLGIGSDLLSSGKMKEEEEKAIADYFAQNTWNPETRAKYASGLQGTASSMLEGLQRRTASQGAEAGRGGGFFSNRMASDRAKINEMIAKEVGKTYQPQNIPLGAYQARASASTPTWARTLSGVSDTAGKMLPYYLMMQMMNRG